MVSTSQKPITLGLDVGGTRIKGIALDSDQQITRSYEGPSDAQKGPKGVRRAIGLAIEYFRSNGLTISHIGIGCAGSIDSKKGTIRNSPNFVDCNGIPLQKWIEDDYRLPVIVDNDANCAVLAEWKLGNAIGHRNVVLLTLGTGIGAGLILNRPKSSRFHRHRRRNWPYVNLCGWKIVPLWQPRLF